MSIIGIGCDLVQVSHFEPDNLASRLRVFTKQEMEYCDNKWHSAQHYAARWAAKEAVLKALDLEFKYMSHVEVIKDATGPPRIKLSSDIMERVGRLGTILNVHLSLSHTVETGMASVVAERN